MLTLLLACGNPSLETDDTSSASDDTGPSSSDDTGEAPSGGDALVINEFMASNATGLTDEGGAYPDWIELYNGTDAAIDLGGYTMSDDAETPDEHVLADLTIDAGGYLVLFADGDVKEGDLHLAFGLRRSGEAIHLWDTTGAVVDSIEYGEQVTDISYARVTDGAAEWDYQADPTPGAAN